MCVCLGLSFRGQEAPKAEAQGQTNKVSDRYAKIRINYRIMKRSTQFHK